MSQYSTTAKDINRMIKRNGQTVTVYYDTPGTYNRNTQTVELATTSATAKAVILPVSTENNFHGLVQAGDWQILLSAYDTDGNELAKPNEGNRIKDSAGSIYQIKQALPVAPAGTTLFFDGLLKGAGA